MRDEERRGSGDCAKLRIVVVDDDASVRAALGRLLRAAGCEVYAFESAEAFLGSRESTGVDCLIVDIHLGGMDGLELHARLGSVGPLPPTVFITAYDEPKIVARPPPAGGVVFLRKPVDDDSLWAAIDLAVEGTPSRICNTC